jgi:hypothetical protein
MARVLLLASVTFAVVGCSSPTQLVSSRRDPRFSGPIKFKKTLAIAVNHDPLTRRVAEDAMTKEMKAANATPAYEVLTDAERVNGNIVMSRAKALGFDGIVSMRMLSNRVRTSVDPAAEGPGGFYSYYDGSMVMMADPGAIKTEQVTSIETRIYSVSDGMLIWSGVSDTVNLSTIKQAVVEVAKVVRSKLRQEGLLP